MLFLKNFFTVLVCLSLLSCDKDSKEKSAGESFENMEKSVNVILDDSKEKIAGESFENMEQLVSVLKTISDKSSAEKAKPQLIVLAQNLINLQSRAKALNLSDVEMNSELKKNKERLDNIKSEMRVIQEKIGKNLEVAQIIGPILGKVN